MHHELPSELVDKCEMPEDCRGIPQVKVQMRKHGVFPEQKALRPFVTWVEKRERGLRGSDRGFCMSEGSETERHMCTWGW